MVFQKVVWRCPFTLQSFLLLQSCCCFTCRAFVTPLASNANRDNLSLSFTQDDPSYNIILPLTVGPVRLIILILVPFTSPGFTRSFREVVICWQQMGNWMCSSLVLTGSAFITTTVCYSIFRMDLLKSMQSPCPLPSPVWGYSETFPFSVSSFWLYPMFHQVFSA